MIVKGKFKTEQNRILDFEFKTIDLEKTLGSSGYWFDNTFSTSSEITINGKSIGTDYYNYCLTDEFKKMYKNSVVTEFNDVIFDEFDTNVISNDVEEYVNSSDVDFQEWFKKEYGISEITSENIGDNFNCYIEEYICCIENLHSLFESVFELSNGYHCLSQWNILLESLNEYFEIGYEEDNQ